jgi:NAD(P)-dependent dehydrogenase (short-subunit alcohol dehydrogenase family)
VRNTDAGDRTAAEITAKTGNTAVQVGRLELADRASISDFVANWTGPLHILVSNAGVMALPELQLTPEGWEMQFATNHLGHFELALGLHDVLAAAGDARIVSLSSRGHLRSPVVFEDINFSSRPYDAWLAYGQSKTANILFAVEATRHWAEDGITANAVPPRRDHRDQPVAAHEPSYLADLRASAAKAADADTYDRSQVRFKTIEQGAATSVLVATSPQLEGIGGPLLRGCNEARVLDPDAPSTTNSGVAAYALDPQNARRLWDVSLDMLENAATRQA